MSERASSYMLCMSNPSPETWKGLQFTGNVLRMQVERFEAASWIQKLKMGNRDNGRKEESCETNM